MSDTQTLPSSEKKSKVLKWFFIIGIAVVLNLFVGYAVQLVYPEPQYEDFCTASREPVIRDFNTEESCRAVGGQWNEATAPKPVAIQQGETHQQGYCDQDFTCREQHQDTLSIYNRNVFIVFVVVGVTALIGATLLSAAEAVSLGLSFGGILALIIGSVRYWSDMHDWLRVIILGLALVTLIWLGYKKFKE